MQVDYGFEGSIVASILQLAAWGILGFTIYSIYRKQEEKPKMWKAALIALIGIFSFSITLPWHGQFIKVPVLPLGAWFVFLYFNRRGEGWQRFRRFAWSGFFANFLFLTAALAAPPIENLVYPEDAASTYIADADHASVTLLYPAADSAIVNEEALLGQVKEMKRETVRPIEWHEESWNRQNERFPYQLTGTSPKWGSGIPLVIYVEKDGKGLLVETPENQFYFRSPDSFLEGGE
ncbi:hypothetical protein [Bacillus marinisedimentorum]|uniref:hypothetical protein n=1 Tax=Bacillus marinisedimentorum TaxID=1821260 RepID=UPI000871C08A|nr:hypothetical protein [Bacillus marinisedimentorum]